MYRHVAVFTLEGDFLGYAIKQENAHKLQSTNLYSETEEKELGERLTSLNEAQAVTAAWPDARDPEVVALLNDPTFEPIEMIEDSVLDEERSTLVYLKDALGQDTFEVDPAQSVLRYKKAKVPARPSDVMQRVKNACEIIARQRLQSS